MSTLVPARELRNSYTAIISRVRSGERITVTLDGVPAIDLSRHEGTSRPPRFRDTGQLPVWSPLPAGVAADWLLAHHARAGFDESPRDPWAPT